MGGGRGYVRVDVALPEPVAGEAGRALLLLDGTFLVGHASADVHDDGRVDAVVLLDGPNETSSLVFGRALLSGASCESMVTLDATYQAIDALQHPDGSGWLVLRGADGFVAATL